MVLSIAAAYATFETTHPQKDPVLSYRNWTKVTPKPVPISDNLDLLCRGLTLREQAVAMSPHRKRAITVFVNAAGTRAMTLGQPFPEGSAIVKEKQELGFGVHPKRHEIQAAGPVVLSTFMVKREKGYNPECGDWEFGVVDGPTRKILERGKLANCMKCHIEKKDLDYTFRSYLRGKS